MRKTLTLGIFILGCCLSALTQMGGYYQLASGSSAFGDSQHQPQPTQDSAADQLRFYPGSADDPSAMSANQSAKQKTTVQGCLARSREGMFILSDAAGHNYQLNDNISRLSEFVGKEIRVDGFGLFNGDAAPGAMSLDLSATQQIEVTRVRKIADQCQSRSGVR